MRHDPTRRKKTAAAALVITAFALLTACGESGNDDAGAPNQAPAASASDVTMQLVSFRPETVTVEAGTTVTWTQKDPGFHTVTSGTVEQGGVGVTPAPDGRFDSGELATGKTFTHTFDQSGTYSYFCEIHPATMRGVVQVS